MQWWLTTRKLIFIIYHVNTTKGKKHTIISNDAEKSLDIIQHPLLKKKKNPLIKLRIQAKLLNIIKGI